MAILKCTQTMQDFNGQVPWEDLLRIRVTQWHYQKQWWNWEFGILLFSLSPTSPFSYFGMNMDYFKWKATAFKIQISGFPKIVAPQCRICWSALLLHCTICPRSSCPFYKVSYYITWVTTSWTYSMLEGIWIRIRLFEKPDPRSELLNHRIRVRSDIWIRIRPGNWIRIRKCCMTEQHLAMTKLLIPWKIWSITVIFKVIKFKVSWFCYSHAHRP